MGLGLSISGCPCCLCSGLILARDTPFVGHVIGSSHRVAVVRTDEHPHATANSPLPLLHNKLAAVGLFALVRGVELIALRTDFAVEILGQPGNLHRRSSHIPKWLCFASFSSLP